MSERITTASWGNIFKILLSTTRVTFTWQTPTLLKPDSWYLCHSTTVSQCGWRETVNVLTGPILNLWWQILQVGLSRSQQSLYISLDNSCFHSPKWHFTHFSIPQNSKPLPNIRLKWRLKLISLWGEDSKQSEENYTVSPSLNCLHFYAYTQPPCFYLTLPALI